MQTVPVDQNLKIKLTAHKHWVGHFQHVCCWFFCFQGACILNMLRDFLTPEAFEVGIIRYLKRYSYQNTVNSHLWESLTNVSLKTRVGELE